MSVSDQMRSDTPAAIAGVRLIPAWPSGLTGDLGLVDSIRPLLEAHLDDPDEQIRRHVREVLEGSSG
jgi:hypothetical protein